LQQCENNAPRKLNTFHDMGAGKSSSSIEFEEDRRIGRAEEEDRTTAQNFHKAASDVTAALFAIELLDKPDTPRAEFVSKASKLLSEASEELKKALDSRQPQSTDTHQLLKLQ
jgi:hypothetical protein